MDDILRMHRVRTDACKVSVRNRKIVVTYRPTDSILKYNVLSISISQRHGVIIEILQPVSVS